MISLFLNDTKFSLSILLTILGIILTMYIYYKGIKYRQISYMYQTSDVISKDMHINKLSFIYENNPLENLSITDIIIWSNGKEIINRDDIAPLAPLVIHSSSSILNYHILFSNEKCNNFQVTHNNNDLAIDFDYISKNEGLAIRIIHTGDCKDFSVTCKIKAGRKIAHVNRRKGFLYTFLNNKFVKYILSRKLTSFIFLVFTICFFPIAFVQSGNYTNNNFFNLPNTSLFMNLDSIIIGILCICSFLLSAPHLLNLFKNDPPENLISHTFCER